MESWLLGHTLAEVKTSIREYAMAYPNLPPASSD